MRLTTSPALCAECHEIWEPKPPGTLWATPGLLRNCFTFVRILERTALNLSCFKDVTEVRSIPSAYAGIPRLTILHISYTRKRLYTFVWYFKCESGDLLMQYIPGC